MTPMPSCRKAGPVMNTAPQASSKVSAAHLRRGAYLYLLSELRREFSQFTDGF